MFELDNEEINKVTTINGSSVSGSLVASSVDLDLVNRAVSANYRGYKEYCDEYDEDIRLMNTVFSKKLYKYLENLDLSSLIDNIVSEKTSNLQDDLDFANTKVRFLEEDLRSLRSEIWSLRESLRSEMNDIRGQIESKVLY